jgi:hypothetical protein
LVGSEYNWEVDLIKRCNYTETDCFPHVKSTLPVEYFEWTENVQDEHYPDNTTLVDTFTRDESSLVDALYDVQQEEDKINGSEDRCTVEGLSGRRCVIVCELKHKAMIDVVSLKHVYVDSEYPHINHEEAEASPHRKVPAEDRILIKGFQGKLLQCNYKSND